MALDYILTSLLSVYETPKRKLQAAFSQMIYSVVCALVPARCARQIRQPIFVTANKSRRIMQATFNHFFFLCSIAGQCCD